MNQPLLVTAAIIEKDEKLLLVKRAREPFKGHWCFIGGCGAFEEISDPKEAIKIEVLGDINCKFEPEFFTFNQEKFEVSTLTLFFCGKIEGVPKADPKYVSEYKWFDKSEVREFELGFDHNLIVDMYLKKLSKKKGTK